MTGCTRCGRIEFRPNLSFCACGGPLAPATVVARRPRQRRRPDSQPVRSKRQTKRNRIFARDGYRCVACGTDEDLTLDHRIPKSRGGSDADGNLQTMCRSCNQAKADSMPAELAGSV